MASESQWLLSSPAQANLMARVGVDAVSAATTALAIAPVVTVIDSTVMMRASSGNSFRACLSQFLRPLSSIPHKLFLSRPARLVFAVYFGTYLTANAMDTASSTMRSQPASTVSATTTKFAATAVVSTGLTIYKDSRLAQIFGQSATKRLAVPLTTYSLFTLRDAITIFASFNLPTLLAPRLAGMVEGEARRLKTAQFLLPAAIQFITTPIHLLGLDMHNRRGILGVNARAARVVRDVGPSISIRIVRILPAFGVGGVLNLSMRSSLMDSLESRA